MNNAIRKHIESLRRAIEAAYTGSAEHGSFLRGGTCEYVPSVFMTLNELESAVAVELDNHHNALACPYCTSGGAVAGDGSSQTETASGYLRAEAYFKSIQYLSARVAELEAKVDRWTASLDEAEGAYTTAFGAVKFLRARMEESFPPSRDHADTEPTR